MNITLAAALYGAHRCGPIGEYSRRRDLTEGRRCARAPNGSDRWEPGVLLIVVHGMQKPPAESPTERLARYRRQAQECRDKAAHGLDQKSRRRCTALAEYYDLLITLENVSAPGGVKRWGADRAEIAVRATKAWDRKRAPGVALHGPSR